MSTDGNRFWASSNSGRPFPEEVEVAVVGAGPTGLTLAASYRVPRSLSEVVRFGPGELLSPAVWPVSPNGSTIRGGAEFRDS